MINNLVIELSVNCFMKKAIEINKKVLKQNKKISKKRTKNRL